MNVPEDLKYTESHEWIEHHPDAACGVGITDHAQSELSDVVYVELPEIGRVVAAGDPVAVVESVKAASDIYAPVAGEIVGVNEALANDPALVNSDPYGEGFLFRLRPAEGADFSVLLTADGYRAAIG